MMRHGRHGFTLLELLCVIGIFLIVIATATGSWLLFVKKANRVDTQAALDMDVRKVLERFRTEVRNSSSKTIMFYPTNQPPYQAVSFALGTDNNGDGLVDMDAGGSNILWSQTVVYHVWNGPPMQEMRRTVFGNRFQNATAADRYNQIAEVASSGTGTGACLSGEQAVTTVLFANLFTGKLWQAEATFDGYAAQSNTLEQTTFGSALLEPGAHTVNFTIVGKNPASTGRALRFDQLSASVSGWPLEAEWRNTTGVTTAPCFVGPGLAGAAYVLQASTAANGDHVGVTVNNDAIEECVFIGANRNVAISNTIVRFDSACQPLGFQQGVYVTALDGVFTNAWDGGEQTGEGVRSIYFYPTNCAIRIPILASSIVHDGFGPVFRFYKSLYNGNLSLQNPMFAVVTTPTNTAALLPDVGPNSLMPLVFYQNGMAKASWSACDNKSYLELRPAQAVRIALGSTLIVSFQVDITSYGADCFTAFNVIPSRRSTVPGCWMIPEDGSNAVARTIWSTNPLLQTLTCLPTLETMAVGYAGSGTYTSTPFDTHSLSGSSKTFTWDADVPTGASLTNYVRSANILSSNGFDIADAQAWPSVPASVNGAEASGSGGRYLQFRSVFSSQPWSQFPGVSGGTAGSGPYRSATPRLRRALFTWDGDDRYVDVAGTMLKGPDCGMFTVDVDGTPLLKGVTMEIAIYKDLRVFGSVSERLYSAATTEVVPRNN